MNPFEIPIIEMRKFNVLKIPIFYIIFLFGRVYLMKFAI